MNKVLVNKINDIDTLKEALKIRNKVFTVEKGVPVDIEVDEYDDLNDDCDHFIIEYNSNKVGTIRCLKNNDIVKVQRFCILSNYRNLGIGNEVLKYIEEYYKKEQKSKIIMDAKYSVYKFYEKCGYKAVSNKFIEAGIEHIKMEKDL